MTRIMLMIKKNWIYILLAFSIIFFVVTRFTNNHKGEAYVTSKTFYTDSLGWGYEILVNNKRLIRQEIIPVVSGRKGFVSEAEAATVAKLVIRKMSTTKFPTVTQQELDSCGITNK